MPASILASRLQANLPGSSNEDATANFSEGLPDGALTADLIIDPRSTQEGQFKGVGALVFTFEDQDSATAYAEAVAELAPDADHLLVGTTVLASGPYVVIVSKGMPESAKAEYLAGFKTTLGEAVPVAASPSPTATPRTDLYTLSCYDEYSDNDEELVYASLSELYAARKDDNIAPSMCTATLTTPDAFTPTPKQRAALKGVDNYSDDYKGWAGKYATLLEMCAAGPEDIGLFLDVDGGSKADKNAALVLCPDNPRAAKWRNQLRRAQLEDSGVLISGDGTYDISQIKPGTWRSTAGVTDCYWERSSPGGDTIDNDFVTYARNGVTVTIASSDGGFTTQGCGSWKRIG